MARRSGYDADEVAGQLCVPAAAFRWAWHTGVVPAPDASSWQWSPEAVEAMDAEAVKAAMPREAISAEAAADRVAAALDLRDRGGDKGAVTAFVVRRLIERRLLTDLAVASAAELLNPDQVDAVCARPDLARLVAEESPLTPAQASDRIGVRRTDFDHMVRLGWVHPVEWRAVRFGAGRGVADLPLFRTADIDALPATHPEIDWTALRSVERDRC